MNNVNLYDYFQKKALKTNSLFQVELDVTASCNASCPFCFQGDCHEKLDNELSFHEIVTLLEDLRRLGTYYIGFSGGEPFTRNDFLEILREAKKRGFRVSFITNAMLLNESIIDELEDIGVDRITISFHSANKDNYMRHFGIKNDLLYYKALSNIAYLNTKNILLGFAVTVTKYNIDELDKIEEYVTSLKLSKDTINYNMLLKGNSEIFSLMPTDMQIRKNNKFFFYKDSLLNKTDGKGLICIAGKSSCSINSIGEVFPCTFFNNNVGNIKSTSIVNIWNNSHFLKIFRSIKDEHFLKCQSCSSKNKCTICMASNINETNDIFVPSESYCNSRKAKVNYND